MRIGINGSVLHGNPSIDAYREHATQAVADGFSSYWLAQTGIVDALTIFTAIADAVPDIEFGTAVVPTFPRHPWMLAGQALTTAAVTGPRLVLGIGLAHKPTVEGRLEIPFEKPLRHMREYLAVLKPLMEDGKADSSGEIWSGHLDGPRIADAPPSLMLAALGPQMLRLCGREADGTILWMVGPRTIEGHIAPTLNEAAESVGRDKPRIVTSLPVCVTDDVDGVRQRAAAAFVVYGELPSYKAMLDREGVSGPEDVAIIGSEAEVADQLRDLDAAGTTDFAPIEFGADPDEQARTRAVLKAAATGA